MILEPPAPARSPRTLRLDADLVIVGGGLAGACAAVTAARAGLRVALVHDRPVLGGNASSEVRLWVLGATAHMGGPNRWAREGGVINEILVENQHRNPEGNPLIFDTVLLELARHEPNLTLLLNTACFEATKSPADPDRIAAVRAFCPQNSTLYHLHAPLFLDSSGDGILGFLSGAAFRMGAEPFHEFGEKFAPSQAYGQLLGHSLYFYTKDTGHPVHFTPPSFALKNIEQAIPRYRGFQPGVEGCRLWWIEYGGRLDTVHDTETIKWELWKVVYGVWDYLKNSGKFPQTATSTLEWVGAIPGKRESRRFEGDYLLTQHDVIEQRTHDDDVSFGGWALDLHPADGVYSDLAGCTHWRAPGVYPIPYRCLYSRNITNLFLAGRLVSVTHAAFGSTRVMGTCAHSAQAVALAAAHCLAQGLLPRDLLRPDRMRQLQRDLHRTGQYLPRRTPADELDLARTAAVTASSTLQLSTLPPDGPLTPLAKPLAQMLPLLPGPVPAATLHVTAAAATTLAAELRISADPENHTPDTVLDHCSVPLAAGFAGPVTLRFDARVGRPCYGYVCLAADPHLAVQRSNLRVTGVLALQHQYTQDPATGSHGITDADRLTPDGKPDLGVPVVEMWLPQRRPLGHNLALTLSHPLPAFEPTNATTGPTRPTRHPNAWVADPADPRPTLTLQWPTPQTIRTITLTFDADYDHPMESVLMGHPERDMPFCVRAYRLRADTGQALATVTDNHQPRNTHTFATPVTTTTLTLEITATHGAPAALFELACFA